MRLGPAGVVLAAVLTAAPALPAARAGLLTAQGTTSHYGDVEFPRDEHQHLSGWDYWWGAADLVTESGARYTVGIAFDSFDGYGITGHQVFAHQGPYDGLSIMTADGPTEWGHPGETTGDFYRKMSVYVPGVSDLLTYETLDTRHGFKDIGRWERVTLDEERYHLRLDNDEAKVHPSGDRVKLVVDLEATMHSPPLLAGGTGTWWYGIPQTYGYPSRSFQYMQAARSLTGTLTLEQPDGSMVEETVVSEHSSLVMVHEYDATPEDLFAGLALAESTQLHPRYAQYYEGGMPWELIFLDLDNDAQLMVAVLAFHDTEKGTLTPVTGPDQPTYDVLATLRLPTGESVPLNDELHVEHLSYRHIVGRVPTFAVAINGVWTQSWDYRLSYPGGTVVTADGSSIDVPPFDLGVVPQLSQSEPAVDDRGNRLTQRVPFTAAGSFGTCPVRGFGWSELIVNWYGHEDDDPWFTGGPLPSVPSRCDDGTTDPPRGSTGPLTPPTGPFAPPEVTWEGCTAWDPTPTCAYDATIAGGVGGYGAEPGGWTVTITRPGEPDPIVVTSFGGQEMYACGTILPGDHVEATAEPGSGVVAGDPAICV